MEFSPKNASDEELKCRAIELLANGLVPFEQWANVFANPTLDGFPNLKSKAFSVWFPTMTDFLVAEDEFNCVKKYMKNRSLDDRGLFENANTLADWFKELLSLFSTDEQIFIRDRRLQNVHGILHLGVKEKHEIRYWNAEENKLRKVELTGEQYRNIVAPFYFNLGEKSKELVSRLVNSGAFIKFSDVYKSDLKFPELIERYINEYGVSAACGK